MTILLTSFNVLNQLQVDIDFSYNPYGFLATDLFEVGARVNPKRSFLFVSKLIGKHLDVHPDTPKVTGKLLAELFVRAENGDSPVFDTKPLVEFVKTGKKTEEVEQALSSRLALDKEDRTLFIGFAETATGLGHAVFSAFENASFIHTTREDLNMESVFDFEEEHSHAVDHRCYLLEQSIMSKTKHVVLIDDEMTTGKTSLNLIKSLHNVYPKEKYTILCLLDWRNDEEKQAYSQLENELGIKISVVSLTEGSMKLSKQSFFKYEEKEAEVKEQSYRYVDTAMIPKVEVVEADTKKYVKYPLYTGRFGISSEMHDEIEKSAKDVGQFISSLRRGGKTLVLGMGEFMYIPSRIASYMGDGVVHKTTTRSPIYPFKQEGYPIHDRISFKDDHGVTYYSYNLEKNEYDELIIISEKYLSKDMRNEMASAFADKGIKEITFVVL